jgi:hypothetical protein
MMDYGKLIGAIIGSINAIKNIGLGAKQARDGKNLQKKLDAQGRPILETPEAFNETEGLVRSNYLDPRLAGEDRIKDSIKSRESNQIQNIQQTAGSGADALLAYGLSGLNTNKSLFDVDMKAHEQQQNDYNKLLSTLGQKSQYQEAQWMQNVMKPFLEDSEKAKALIAAGQQNVNNGMEDWAGYAMNSMGNSSVKPGNKGYQSGQTTDTSMQGAYGKVADRNGATGVSADMQGTGGNSNDAQGGGGMGGGMDMGSIMDILKQFQGSSGGGAYGNGGFSGGHK